MKTKILKIVLNIFLILQSLSIYSQDFEPRGRYYPEDENIGLPSLGLAGKSLIIGAVLFLIGWIISKIKKDENGNSGSTFGGCLIMLGIICAIPALAWVQAIGASIYIIGVIALVIIGMDMLT
ncbi:hypothetical protein EKL98_14935 [Flavobacterium bomense]|uniref:Uncharacterized protein n=1 Tax=Flavobacterium bomense TaxID=2497483 RepID=A0A3S0PFD3_9FLAO|nr:hypothetical protein [Flavobacterium bomense]RTZ01433.1 hypothetical protein EKL98_14935 [Flavobacterium bomense]